jgi:hypothetical protein
MFKGGGVYMHGGGGGGDWGFEGGGVLYKLVGREQL